MNTQIRQGDVLFIRRQDLDEKYHKKMARILKRPDGVAAINIVVARGEATGHAHTFSGLAAFDGTMLLVAESAVVRHEEHAPVNLTPGVWEVRIQTQWCDVGRVQVVD